MRKSMFAASVTTAMAMVLSLSPALQAHDTSSSRGERGSMMGPEMMKGMGQMMDHCSQMMQGSTGRPNEQWRESPPPKGGQTEKH